MRDVDSAATSAAHAATAASAAASMAPPLLRTESVSVADALHPATQRGHHLVMHSPTLRSLGVIEKTGQAPAAAATAAASGGASANHGTALAAALAGGRAPMGTASFQGIMPGAQLRGVSASFALANAPLSSAGIPASAIAGYRELTAQGGSRPASPADALITGPAGAGAPTQLPPKLSASASVIAIFGAEGEAQPAREPTPPQPQQYPAQAPQPQQRARRAAAPPHLPSPSTYPLDLRFPSRGASPTASRSFGTSSARARSPAPRSRPPLRSRPWSTPSSRPA